MEQKLQDMIYLLINNVFGIKTIRGKVKDNEITITISLNDNPYLKGFKINKNEKTNDITILFNKKMLKQSTESVMKQPNKQHIIKMIRDLEKE
jgi:hypothetical protein